MALVRTPTRIGELREARQRGEDQAQFLAEQERAALLGELLGRRQ